MKVLTTTKARQQFAELINWVRFRDEPVAIGRRQKPEVLLIRYPGNQNAALSDETNVNAHSESFAFLADEPDLYTLDDLKVRYAR